ncbi:MAG TPA: DUF4259 domain-containing protein [Streptosporangiaceae bacterium]|nr:DUF4259 domain-containing protein [Streptosporangiaceae bacterium]
MGAWGEGAFDNDTAADWSRSFRHADQASGLALISDALSWAARTPALRAREGEIAVAAAELVACIAGQPAEEATCSRTAFEWADQMDAAAQPQLTGLALQALAQVTGSGSELADLWDEVPSTWPASIAQLLARLLDASPDSGKEQTAEALLPGHYFQSAVRALTAIPDTALPGVYALSFFCWYQEEDPNKPILTIGYNTEAQVQQTLTELSGDGNFSLPDGAGDARWNYAYWLQNELAVLDDDTGIPSAPNSPGRGSGPAACGTPTRTAAPKAIPQQTRSRTTSPACTSARPASCTPTVTSPRYSAGPSRSWFMNWSTTTTSPA